MVSPTVVNCKMTLLATNGPAGVGRGARPGAPTISRGPDRVAASAAIAEGFKARRYYGGYMGSQFSTLRPLPAAFWLGYSHRHGAKAGMGKAA